MQPTVPHKKTQQPLTTNIVLSKNRKNKMHSGQDQASNLQIKSQEMWSKLQIEQRSDKIIEYYLGKTKEQQKGSVNQLVKSQKKKSQILGAQLSLLKKINQIKQSTQKIAQKNSQEDTQIIELQKTVKSERQKLERLKQKLSNQAQRGQPTTALPDSFFDREIQIQEQCQRLNQQYTQQLYLIEKDKQALISDVNELRQDLDKIRTQIEYIKQKQTQSQNKKILALKQQYQKIMDMNSALKQKNNQLNFQIQTLTETSSLDEQIYRTYIDLYEKVFVTQQLDKLQNLIEARQQQIQKQAKYERNKNQLKDIKKATEAAEKRIRDKTKIIDKLTQQIKHQSNQLLNAYNYTSKKH